VDEVEEAEDKVDDKEKDAEAAEYGMDREEAT
jgi:hypothetical protein